MPEPDRLLGIYLHLARASQLRSQPMVRDKLLVLAGVQAESMGLAPISAICRQRVLAHNARHMIRKWPTLEVALADERFRAYLKQLKRRYSKEKSEHMLASLGIELGRERNLYVNDLEYAAALLDIEPAAIDDLLAGGRDNPSANQGHRPTIGRVSGAGGDSHDARRVRAARVRHLLVVWGPFLLGVTVLALSAVISRSLVE